MFDHFSELLDILNQHKQGLKAIAFLSSSGAFIWGVLKYARSIRQQHANWLHKLFVAFYETDGFKRVRKLYDEKPIDAPKVFTDIQAEHDLDDYLNFFEFIAGLVKMKQVTLTEVQSMFEYWIRLMQADLDTLTYLRRFGYENLLWLMDKLPHDFVFVYGTLMSNYENEVTEQVHPHWRLKSKAFIKGRLYQLGEYPGAIPDPDCEAKVSGELYEILHPAKLLSLLDEYEGSEYQRVRVEARISLGRSIPAWCYVIADAAAVQDKLSPHGGHTKQR
jgi:gamma-glutamylcyclotransferase (GGCT)/AIG2-like uncharacterized protein YtfP